MHINPIPKSSISQSPTPFVEQENPRRPSYQSLTASQSRRCSDPTHSPPERHQPPDAASSIVKRVATTHEYSQKTPRYQYANAEQKRSRDMLSVFRVRRYGKVRRLTLPKPIAPGQLKRLRVSHPDPDQGWWPSKPLVVLVSVSNSPGCLGAS